MEKLSRYQEAALVWLERNPGKTLANYKQKTKVELENGDCVPLGIYLNRIRCIYKAMQKGEKFWSYRDLTNEEIQWWSNLGIVWDTLKEINRSYQEAALVWLEKNPGKTLDDCMQGEEIKLENGEVVKLGVYIGRIRRVTYRYMQNEDKHEQCRILTEEEIQWWSEHGLHWNLKHAGKMQNKDTGDYSTITGMKQFTQNIENDVLSSLKEHISGEWIIDLFHRIIKKSNCSGIYTEQELMNFAE